MFKIPSIQNIINTARETYVRFPLALSIAIIGTAVSIALTYIDHNNTELVNILVKALFTSVLGFLIMIAIQLYSEKSNRSRKRKILLQIVGFFHLVGYFLSISDPGNNVQIYRFIIFLLGLHFLISFVPFLSKGETNAFWQFNKSLFLRLLTAVFYSGILFIGLGLALFAIDQLFNVNISGDYYLRLWIVLAGIFSSWFFLSGIPKNFSILEEFTTYQKGLKIFTQFILIPILSVYFLILYAYLFKIIFTWNIPKGIVSYLVLGYSIAGIFALLLIYPLRNTEGNKWIKTFSKWFYITLFPLIILLMVAIWQRVGQYGITENRYFVIILAILLTSLSVYFLISKIKNIKYIPIFLSIVAFLSVIGPWGVFSISKKSQIHRLNNMLTDAGVMVNERIVKPQKTSSSENYNELSSIIYYLAKNHGFDGIKGWFDQDLDSLFAADSITSHYEKADKILDILILPVDFPSFASTRYFNISSKRKDYFIVKGYDYYLYHSQYLLDNDSILEENAETYNFADKSFTIGYSPSNSSLVISSEDKTLIKIDLAGLLWKIEDKLGNIENHPLVKEDLLNLEKQTDEIKVQLHIKNITGNLKGKNDVEIHDIESDILIKLLDE